MAGDRKLDSRKIDIALNGTPTYVDTLTSNAGGDVYSDPLDVNGLYLVQALGTNGGYVQTDTAANTVTPGTTGVYLPANETLRLFLNNTQRYIAFSGGDLGGTNELRIFKLD